MEGRGGQQAEERKDVKAAASQVSVECMHVQSKTRYPAVAPVARLLKQDLNQSGRSCRANRFKLHIHKGTDRKAARQHQQ
jgi:hypothetical protein